MNARTAVTSKATWLVWLGHVALVIFATAHHEPWRDEAQAWLIARDLPLSGVLAMMGNEGTPGLWHMVLFPFAQLGAPFATAAVIHALFAIAASGLLLFRGPFPLWLGALLVFSSYLSYEYAAIARSYNLSLLLSFGLAALHASRLARPLVYGLLVALLANTNVHSLALAGGLALLFAVDARANPIDRSQRSRRVAALAIMGAGMAASLAQLAPAHVNVMVADAARLDLMAPLVATRNAWLPGLPLATVVVAIATMLVVVAALWRWARPALWLLGCALGGLYLIFVLKHAGGLRHHGLVLVFTVFVVWVAWERLSVDAARRWRRVLLAALGVPLAASLPFSVMAHVEDARGLFSGASTMATYIDDAGLADRTTVAYESAPASALLPHLPGKRFWYADLRAFGTFMIWDRRFVDNRYIGVTEAATRASEAPGWGPGALLLTTAPLPSPERYGLTLRHAVVDEVLPRAGERFYLYERR